MACLTVIDTLKFLTAADRPVDRACMDAEDGFDIFHQVKWILGFTVQLVDKCKNRNMAQHTNLEKLDSLSLNTLGCVDNHDCRICRHQCTVGIFREILMSRCIQNIDTIIFIVKLHNGRSNRNTSFLLNFHPVGDSMLCCFLSLYGAGQIDGTAIEQKLLCQCRLTGIGMGNNCKCTASFYFLFKISHFKSSIQSLIF